MFNRIMGKSIRIITINCLVKVAKQIINNYVVRVAFFRTVSLLINLHFVKFKLFLVDISFAKSIKIKIDKPMY